MAVRQNRTIRPDSVIPDQDQITLDVITQRFKGTSLESLFYLEVIDAEPPKSPSKFMFAQKEKDEGGLGLGITLFVKLFDQVKGELIYWGRYHVKNKTKPISEMVATFHAKLKLGSSVKLRFLEEIKPGMVEAVDTKLPYVTLELGDGDIIIIEKELSQEEAQKARFASAVNYFEEYENRINVTFKPRFPDVHKDAKEIVLALSRKNNYVQVVTALGAQLRVRPEHVLLLQHGMGAQKTPIQSFTSACLQEMIGPQYYPNPPNTLYYEVMEMTIQDFEARTYVRTSYIDSSVKEQGPYELFVIRAGTVKDLVEELLHQIKREEDGSGQLRVYEVSNFKIYRVLVMTDLIQSIPPHSQIYVEVSFTLL